MPGRMQVLQPSFWLLIVILAAFEWMGITYYVRGEFYREKAKDYVGAAIVTGVSAPAIMFRHILPNALTPVISFAPFTIVANIGALVALDFLGFGLPAPTPSWGELIGQGMENLTKWWLVFFPLGVLFLTLLLVVFIGEAVREAFDPEGVLAAAMTAVEPSPRKSAACRTHFFTEAGVAKAVDGVDLDIMPGEVLGLVGESGSGKSVTALSILRLDPDPPGRIVGGEILLQGTRSPEAALGGDPEGPRQGDQHDLPGADDLAESGVHDRHAGDGSDPRARTAAATEEARRARGRDADARSAFPTRRPAWISIRTSCPAACGSA